MTYDIITLGSASIDAFVKTKSEIVKHHHHLDLAYLLGGKILIDELIFTTGGGGTNTAVAFSRLGLKTAFLGCLGNDENGEVILKELKKEKIDFLGKIKKGQTGYSLILAGAADRTILTHKGVNDDLEEKDIPKLSTKWLYVSTMLGKSEKTLFFIIPKLKKQGIKIALNLSQYLAQQGTKKLSPLLKSADILIMNKDEAHILTKKKEAKQMLITLSKSCKGIIVITDGENPIHVLSNNKFYLKKIKKIKPIDSTGAGDAFASGFIYSIIKNKPINTAITNGCKESASVLKNIGAKNILLRRL